MYREIEQIVQSLLTKNEAILNMGAQHRTPQTVDYLIRYATRIDIGDTRTIKCEYGDKNVLLVLSDQTPEPIMCIGGSNHYILFGGVKSIVFLLDRHIRDDNCKCTEVISTIYNITSYLINKLIDEDVYRYNDHAAAMAITIKVLCSIYAEHDKVLEYFKANRVNISESDINNIYNFVTDYENAIYRLFDNSEIMSIIG